MGLKKLGSKIKNTSAAINRKVEGLFYSLSDDGSASMDKVFSKVIIVALVTTFLSGYGFWKNLKNILKDNVPIYYSNSEYLWHDFSGCLYVGGIVALIFLFFFAIKDLKKYEKGSARWKRGLFVFLWGLLAYNAVVFILTLLFFFYVLIFAIALLGGGLSSVVSNKSYKLDDGTKVNGNDLSGYVDNKGNAYDRHGNEFKEK